MIAEERIFSFLYENLRADLQKQQDSSALNTR